MLRTLSFPRWDSDQELWSCGLRGGGGGQGCWNWHLSQDSGMPSLSSHVSPFKHPTGPQSLCLKQPTTLVCGQLWIWQRPQPWAGEIGRDASSCLASFPRSAGPGGDQAYQENAAPDTDTGIASPPPTLQRTSAAAFGPADIFPDVGAHDQGRRDSAEQTPGITHPTPARGLLTYNPRLPETRDEVTAAPDPGQSSPETVSLSAEGQPGPHSHRCCRDVFQSRDHPGLLQDRT